MRTRNNNNSLTTYCLVVFVVADGNKFLECAHRPQHVQHGSVKQDANPDAPRKWCVHRAQHGHYTQVKINSVFWFLFRASARVNEETGIHPGTRVCCALEGVSRPLPKASKTPV